MMVAKYHDGNMKDKEIKVNIEKVIDSSQALRDKKN